MTDFNEDLKEPIDTNDLNLEHNFIINIPKEIIFPSELNQYLKDKVQCLVQENGMLRKNISTNEEEIAESKKQIEMLTSKIKKFESNGDFASVGNIARTKIVDLSKKLREKSSEVETFKAKCFKLEQEIMIFQQKKIEVVESVPEKPTYELEREIKTLQDKISSLNIKVCEERNNALKLKNDLKLANKIMQDEIGESFENLQQLTNNSNWKGRAQIISDLQHKNSELRDKLKTFQERENKVGDSLNQRKSLLEKRLDKITKECEILKGENEDLKKKHEALRLRYKNVEIESNVWKNKFSVASEQMEKDKELLSTISSQNAMNQNNQNEMLKKKDSTIDKLHKDIKDMKIELKREKCKVEQVEKEVQDKNFEIEKLKEKINMFQTYNKSQESEAPKVDERIVQRLEAERIRLVELTEITNQRLIRARTALGEIEHNYRQERHKAAKLEAKIARLQLGDSTERTFYSSTLTKVASQENLEFKLELAEETIKALQTKLDIEKRERELDLQEFSKIIKNHSNCDSKNEN